MIPHLSEWVHFSSGVQISLPLPHSQICKIIFAGLRYLIQPKNGFGVFEKNKNP
jgi:hypothetical protein